MGMDVCSTALSPAAAAIVLSKQEMVLPDAPSSGVAVGCSLRGLASSVKELKPEQCIMTALGIQLKTPLPVVQLPYSYSHSHSLLNLYTALYQGVSGWFTE